MYDGWKIFVISLVVALIVSTGVCLSFYFVFVPYWEARDTLIEVPKVTELTLEEASLILSSRHLLVTVEKAEDPGVPKGRVISQDPPASYRTKRGEVVKLKVSSGTSLAEVPSLSGVSVDEATRLLNLRELEVGRTTKKHSGSIPRNHIISTNPQSGIQVERGSTVDLTVSTGNEMVKVPRLYGKTLANAKAILEDRGLRRGSVNWVTSEDHAFDVVISQSPRPGTSVPKGSGVDVTANKEAY